jgi:hypothetical protein
MTPCGSCYALHAELRAALISQIRGRKEDLMSFYWRKLLIGGLGRGSGISNSLRWVEDLIRAYGIDAFVEIAQASGRRAPDLFEYALPIVKGQIHSVDDLKLYGLALAEIAQISGDYTRAVFSWGLSVVEGEIHSVNDLKLYGQTLAEIAQASGKYTYFVFGDGLPVVKGQIHSVNDLKLYGLALAEIAQTSGNYISAEFGCGLSVVEGRIHCVDDLKLYGQALAEIARAGGSSIFDRQWYGFGEVKALIGAYGIDACVELVQASRWYARAVFGDGLPVVKGQIHSVDDLKLYGLALAEIAQASEGRALFSHGLPVVKGQIHSVDDLKLYGQALAEIDRAVGSCSRIFDGFYGLARVEDLIGAYGIDAFVEIAQASGRRAPDLFTYALPVVEGQIHSVDDLKLYGLALAEIAQATGECTYAVFGCGLPVVKGQIHSVDDLTFYGGVLALLVRATDLYSRRIWGISRPFVEWKQIGRFDDIFTNKEKLIADLRLTRSHMREPYTDSWGDDGYRASGSEIVDPDGAIALDSMISALQETDFSTIRQAYRDIH